ncbi:MAG: cytochrome-c peroxidase [Flavobacteriales bacterium]|nr:cytochrome-c peroxidase [Flavobacteriales bacterium]
MRSTGLFFAIICFVGVLSGCQEESVIPDGNNQPDALDVALEEALLNASNGVGSSFYKLPSTLSDIPQDPKNPLTAAKVELGKLLYHETGMGVHPKKEEGRFTYSCSSCHHADGGFQACLPQGISEGGIGFGLHGEGRYPNSNYPIAELDVQPIRTPSALNIAYQTNVLWNGQFGGTHLNEGTESQWHEGSPKIWNHLGFEGTETQAIAGIKVHRMDMTPSLFQNSNYKQLYYAAFGEIGDDTLMSNVYTGLAIAAYERTLLPTEAPFQKWLNGNSNALSSKEKEGAILFFGKAECASCHNGPALSSMDFYALGMDDLNGSGTYFTNFVDETINFGRGGFTGNAADYYKFKVPQLYNLVQSKFYGHGASFHSVQEVVAYKNKAVQENHEVPMGQLASEFHPLNLSTKEIEAISAFIEYGLYDRNLKRYQPTSIPSGFCFPNNDYRSAQEMGCQ